MYTLAVVTGTRAEYGLLRPVLAQMKKNKNLCVKLLVTGAHLSAQYGYTLREILADGQEIAAQLDILAPGAPPGRAGTAQRTALALQMFLNYLVQSRPSALLALGDRYEMFAAAQAAALLDIPLVHISGGDVTAGADDDWFRHCISKMAKLHFPSCEVYRQRLLRMGEAPNTVFNVGGLGDEIIRNTKLLGLPQLAKQLGLPKARPYALVSLHPETQADIPAKRQAAILLSALEQHSGLYYLFTAANADAGGQEINSIFEEHCKNAENAIMQPSLGSLRYLSAMKYAALVIGNSSSGVVETPTLGVPAVNIGARQAGRITGENVLHCAMQAQAISAAISCALAAAFAQKAKAAKSPYNGGDTSKKIVALLYNALENGALQTPKQFYDYV